MTKNKVTIIGLGYVGIPLLISVAETQKYQAFGYDIDSTRVKSVAAKQNPIDDTLVDQLIGQVDYTVSDQPEIIAGSELIIITVPTPVLDNYTPDYSFIISACEAVAPYLEKNQKIVLESTVNPGVTEEILIPTLEELSALKAGQDYQVGYCPERIDPGTKNWNVKNINRNLGATSPGSAEEIKNFYQSFIQAEINIVSSIKAAEATKIVENTFRDVNIAFVNELAQSFDKLGIDVLEVINGAANKPFAFLPHYPSVGVGGHCIPVDPYYLIERAEKDGFNHRFLKMAREINNGMPNYTVNQLLYALNKIEKSLKNTRIILLGMSYKANVGDMRESPSIKLLSLLRDYGAIVTPYDPYVPKYNTFSSVEASLENQDVVLVATSHSIFKQELTPELLKKKHIRVFLDGQNKFNRDDFNQAGIVYKGIGR